MVRPRAIGRLGNLFDIGNPRFEAPADEKFRAETVPAAGFADAARRFERSAQGMGYMNPARADARDIAGRLRSVATAITQGRPHGSVSKPGGIGKQR